MNKSELCGDSEVWNQPCAVQYVSHSDTQHIGEGRINWCGMRLKSINSGAVAVQCGWS